MELNALKQRSRFRRYEADWQALRGALTVQGDQSVANQAGAAFRSDVNNELQALATLSSGAAAPGTTYAYQLWADTTASLLKQRNAANSAWLVVRSILETYVVSRSSNTILAASDVGRTFRATSAFTQTLTAAATLGDGWFVWYRNDSSGDIIIDPNSSETIDGAATLVIPAGRSCRIVCNGSAFYTSGLNTATAGLIEGYGGSSIPAGWLLCDGSSLLRTDYAALFAAIGTTWGAADGTHFTLPDMRGRALIGDGTGAGLTARTLAGSGGAETVQLSAAEMPSHTHPVSSVLGFPQGGDGGATARASRRLFNAGSEVALATDSVVIGSAGSDAAHNNMQPYKVVKYIISY